MIPSGRAREPLETLKYADYIILNKVNLSSSESVGILLELIKERVRCPIIRSEYICGRIKIPSVGWSSGNWNQRGFIDFRNWEAKIF